MLPVYHYMIPTLCPVRSMSEAFGKLLRLPNARPRIKQLLGVFEIIDRNSIQPKWLGSD